MADRIDSLDTILTFQIKNLNHSLIKHRKHSKNGVSVNSPLLEALYLIWQDQSSLRHKPSFTLGKITSKRETKKKRVLILAVESQGR